MNEHSTTPTADDYYTPRTCWVDDLTDDELEAWEKYLADTADDCLPGEDEGDFLARRRTVAEMFAHARTNWVQRRRLRKFLP